MERRSGLFLLHLVALGEQSGRAKLLIKAGVIQKSNLTGRSNFNDLRFLHAMSTANKKPPSDMSTMIIIWLEVMYGVAMHPTATQDQPLNRFLVDNSSDNVEQPLKGTGKVYDIYNFSTFFVANIMPLGSEIMRRLVTADENSAEPDVLKYSECPSGSRGNYLAFDQTYVKNDQFKSVMIERRALLCMMHCIQNPFVTVTKNQTARTVDSQTQKHTIIDNFHCHADQNNEKQDIRLLDNLQLLT